MTDDLQRGIFIQRNHRGRHNVVRRRLAQQAVIGQVEDVLFDEKIQNILLHLESQL